MAIATIENAKPEMPWTKPPTAAPNAKSQSSEVMPPLSGGSANPHHILFRFDPAAKGE
jgi:hypothetical protein